VPTKVPETEKLPYRARVRLKPDGPVYVMRFQGDRAVFSRRREDGTLEMIIRPDTVSVYPVSDIDPDGIQLLPLPPSLPDV